MAANVICSKISNRRTRVPIQVEENGQGFEVEEEPQFAAINEPHTKPSCCRRFCDFLSRCCQRLRNPTRRRRTARISREISNDGGNPPRNPNPRISEQVAPRMPEEFQREEPGLLEGVLPALPNFREDTNEHTKVDKKRAHPELHLERKGEPPEKIQREEPGLLDEESSSLSNLQTREKTNEPVKVDNKYAPELPLKRVEESPEEVLIEEPELVEDPMDEVHTSGMHEGNQLALEQKANSAELKTVDEEEGSGQDLPISDNQNCSASSGFDLALAVNTLIDEELVALEEQLTWIVNSSSPVGPEDFNDVLMKLDDLEEDYFSLCPFYAQPEEALKFAVLRSLRPDK